MVGNNLFCRIGRFLILFFGVGIVWFLFGSQSVFADGEEIYFGSESYEWEVGEENPIGIYTSADSTIDSFYYVVTYDPEVLEYVRGGIVLSDHEIEVRVNDVEDSTYVLYLYFKPITADATIIGVEDIQITGSDGAVTNPSSVSVGVNGGQSESGILEDIKINGASIPGFQSDKTEYTVYVKSDVTVAEIETFPSDIGVDISDTTLEAGNNEIEITCNADGSQVVYILNVYRPQVQDIEEKSPEQSKDEQNIIDSIRELHLTGILIIVIGVLLVLIILFMILCILKIKMKKEKKRIDQKEYLRNQEKERNQLRNRRQIYSGEDSLLIPEEFSEESDTFIWEEPEEDDNEDFLDDSDDCEIQVRNVTMDFKRERDESSSVKEMVIRMVKHQRSFEHFRALDNISFNIKKGEVVGIIGSNGSGKSTILKIISGALIPTQGYVKADKQKIQLLTLGTGFDRELTGKENVYLNGALIGYTKEYIDERYDDIVKFAELEGFMEERVKNYSSGMVSRLGFAIATSRSTPEILILDEVLSVGDIFFRKKSEKRIQEMIHGGSTVLIVSHSTAVIRNNCTKVVWIERGRLRAVGDPTEVCDAYERMSK